MAKTEILLANYGDCELSEANDMNVEFSYISLSVNMTDEEESVDEDEDEKEVVADDEED